MNYFLFITLTTIVGFILGNFLGNTLLFAVLGFIISLVIVGEINAYQIQKTLNEIKKNI